MWQLLHALEKLTYFPHKEAFFFVLQGEYFSNIDRKHFNILCFAQFSTLRLMLHCSNVIINPYNIHNI